jgi:hypothetical protein
VDELSYSFTDRRASLGQTWWEEMQRYRIVKWKPNAPESKQLAVSRLFTDLTAAEHIMARLQQELPDWRFAIEPMDDSPDPEK